MNRILALGLFLVFGGSVMAATRSDATVVERGADHRVWQKVSSRTLPNGRVLNQTNRYTEIGNGLNYWNGTNWAESKEEIELVRGGAIARQGQHKASFAANINSTPALELTTVDNKVLRTRILGIAYYDPVTGRSELIGELRDAIGELVGTNQIIYRDCFLGAKADVRFTYTRAGFEQDVIIREKLPPPQSYDLSEHSRVQVWTELFDAPVPVTRTQLLRQEEDPALRVAMTDPDFKDTSIDFGRSRIVRGRAFSIQDDLGVAASGIKIGKEFLRIDGRDFLVESAEFSDLGPLLEVLPAAVTAKHLRPAARKSLTRSELVGMLSRIQPKQRSQNIQMAKANARQENGVVLDYLISGTLNNFTFQADTTYFVDSTVWLTGETVLEGGTVIKLGSNGWLDKSEGTIVCLTDSYKPAVFTSKDDNLVGTPISGSTGNPQPNENYSFYLRFESGTGSDLKHLRMSYANYGVGFDLCGTSTNILSHCQFVRCKTALFADSSEFTLRNALITDVDTAFLGYGFIGSAEHLTVNRCAQLTSGFGSAATLALTNSILAAVTNAGDVAYSSEQVYTAADPASVFVKAVGGEAYLAASSPYRNVGTVNINPGLLADLRKRTTYAPVLLSSNIITSDTVLSPQVQRDTDALDAGFHYEPLDYLVHFCQITNATVTLTNGVSVGTIGWPGFFLWAGGNIISEGSPVKPNHIAHQDTVQETPVLWGTTAPAWAGSIVPFPDLGPLSIGKFRFTTFDMTSGGGYHFYTSDYWRFGKLSISDCEFNSGAAFLQGAEDSLIGITNNLFHRVYTYFAQSPQIDAYNNLFKGGVCILERQGWISTNNWIFRDNCFDITDLSLQLDGIIHSHNAYISGTTPLEPANSSDKVLASLDYQKGPLGRFYQVTNSALINQGSANAANAGLFHHTLHTNQTRESTTQVDIGYHYAALNDASQASDSDSDGVPDYVEDTNGNGVGEAGETSYTNNDFDADGLTDFEETAILGTNPANRDTDSDGISDADEDADADRLSNAFELQRFDSSPVSAHTFNATAKDGTYLMTAPMDSTTTMATLNGFSAGPGQIRLVVVNAAANESYDIYHCGILSGPWTLYHRGTPGQTEFILDVPSSMGSFEAGVGSDSDNDGLPDGYELLVTQTVVGDSSDGGKDPDNDGLTHYAEFINGTNPHQADVAPPRIAPGNGTFVEPQTVQLFCSTEGVLIYYTLDGTEPTALSASVLPGQSLPNAVSSPTTLKAKAWKAGLFSKTVEAHYSFGTGIPLFSPPAGIYRSGMQVQITDAHPDSTIRYTTDGSEPTELSPQYSQPISLTASATVKAKAWRNGVSGGVASALYSIRSGPVNDSFDTRLSLTGDSGITHGTIISSGISPAEWFFMRDTESISGILEWDYSVWLEWTPTTSTRVCFDTSGSDFGPKLVFFTGNTLGEYTPEPPRIDGLTEVTRSLSHTVTFDAVAGTTYKIGVFGLYLPGNYVLRWYPLNQIDPPILSNPGGTFAASQAVKVLCNTPSTTLRYTLDGTVPTESSFAIANGASISIIRSSTLKVKAWHDDCQPSDTVTGTYVIDRNASAFTASVAIPTITPADIAFSSGVSVDFACATEDATIRYTLDGTEPTEASASASTTVPLSISESTVVKSRAFKAGVNPSSTVRASFAKQNVDTDFDGIPDDWEMLHGSDMFVPDAQGASPEPFGHGLTHLQVYSNPSVLLADDHSSANDGIPDWWKIRFGYSLTDSTLHSSVGANGLSLQSSYEGVFDPHDQNSRPDVLASPNYSVQMGPQNQLYLIIHELPANASRLHLFCTHYTLGSETTDTFVLDLHFPSGAGTLPIPSERFIDGDLYRFDLQIEDGDGRLSPKVRSGPNPEQEFFRFTSLVTTMRHELEFRLRAAGGGQFWLDMLHLNHEWDDVPLPTLNMGQWEIYFVPISQIQAPPSEIYIGEFYNLIRDFLGDWDLRDSGLALRHDSQLNKYYLDCVARENVFGLKYLSFRFQFLDLNGTVTRDITIHPAESVELNLAEYAGWAKVSQTVEAATTEPSSFVFTGADELVSTLSSGAPSWFWPGNGSTAPKGNYVHTMDVEQTSRLYAWSKESIKNANGEAIPNQFVHVQRYFDKAFRCDDVLGDVPRTSEDNMDGKTKIDIARAEQSGLLSPYGDFTPTNTGKYVLTTMPDANGKYGECTVYVLPSQIVTRDPDEGVELPVEDDILYTSAPVPDVTLNLLAATINSAGELEIQVSARVVDRLSEVADDPAERLQQLKFILNGEEVDLIDDLPSLSPGSGVLPWQPYRLDVPVAARTFIVPNPGPGVYLLRAESSENAVGNVGWDEIGVTVGSVEVPFGTVENPVTLVFSEAPTSTTSDSLQIFFGDRAPQASDPVCSESSGDSSLFNGSIDVSGTGRPCEVRIKGPLSVNGATVESFFGKVTYSLDDGSPRSLFARWKATQADSLRFVSTVSSSGVMTPVVSHAEELDGASKGSFSPVLVRFSAPRSLVDVEGIEATINGVPQSVAPFTFSPERYFLVALPSDSKPRLLVITTEKLPPGLNALTPADVPIPEAGEELEFKIQHEGRIIANATVTVLKDNYTVKPPRFFGLVRDPITMDVLLSYFKLLYGDIGLTLLHYYESDPDNLLQLGNFTPDGDVDFFRPDATTAIQIEQHIDPVSAAGLLWEQLNRAFPHYTHELDGLEVDALNAARTTAIRREVLQLGQRVANGYLTGLAIANEGADLAITLDEFSKGNWSSAAGILPFVPATVTKVKIKNFTGDVVLEVGQKETTSLSRVLKITDPSSARTRLLRVREFSKMYDEGVLTAGELRKVMLALHKSGITDLPKNRSREFLAKELGDAPKGMKDPQAHHDLPITPQLEPEFLAAGLDPNDHAYGRWIPGAIHKPWSNAKGYKAGGPFNQTWKSFLFDSQGNSLNRTKEEILDYLSELTGPGGRFYYQN